jgi:hypothetical protein
VSFTKLLEMLCWLAQCLEQANAILISMLDFVGIRHSDLHVPIRQTNVTSLPSSHLLHTRLTPSVQKKKCHTGFRAGQSSLNLTWFVKTFEHLYL